MPKKKKEINDKPKVVGLFDHVKNIFEKQDPNYFKGLSDGDKKTWSNYMILRILSMDIELVETISYIQKYSPNLEPEHLYKLLIGFIPRGRRWNPYIKGKKDTQFEKWLIELFSRHFEVKERDATEYLHILSMTGKGREEIKTICRMYGTEPKLIEKLNI